MAEIKSIAKMLGDHAFFAEMPESDIALVAGCARNARFAAGEPLARRGEPADAFFLIRRGRVSVELDVPGQGHRILQTLHPGDVAGWSWLFPPHRWAFDLRALDGLSVTAFDGRCLRDKCEEDPALGYRLMKRFSQAMTDRLEATRVQLLDAYAGDPPVRPGVRATGTRHD